MSLAKSYANLRKYGHKMAAGGMCEACGDKCKYQDGGAVKALPSESPRGEDVKKAQSVSIWDKAKSLVAGKDPYSGKDRGPGLAKGGKVKGVNKPESDNIQGVSRAGAHLRDVRFAEKGSSLKKAGMSVAKNLHKETLKEMEEMPSPKLKGLAKGGEVGSRKENHAYNYDADAEQKGVHKVLPRYGRIHEKGKGMRFGESTGNSNWKGTTIKTAKDRHKDVLQELKEMPAPKLRGLADGGKVSGFDLNDQAVANWMSEGKMTGEAEGGEIESANEEMLEQCAGELIEAFESKNKKEILDSIKAIVLSLKG